MDFKKFGSDEINGRDWSSLAKNVLSTYDAHLEFLKVIKILLEEFRLYQFRHTHTTRF